MTEIESLLILNMVPGLGSRRIQRLIKRFGSGRNVLAANRKQLTEAKTLSEKGIEHLLRFAKDDFLRTENTTIIENNISIITYSDINYPEQLRELPDAPVILYVKGDIGSLNNPSLAIVGSRRASIYGLAMAEKFAVELAELGFTIVSGMARGIDSSAHRGCLRAGGRTIAVLGCGLANVYPPENKKLFEEISCKGAVISEFPMQAQPLAYHFPQRNRIVSGLSLGVVVVEAAKKSGALITSDFAPEQGKEVFAVPGKADHPNAQGVHGLIKQGAKLTGCVEDIVEELRPQIEGLLSEERSRRSQNNIPVRTGSLTQGEQKILDLISDRPVHVDELSARSGSKMPLTAAVLLSLELKQLVRQLPGKVFVLRHKSNVKKTSVIGQR